MQGLERIVLEQPFFTRLGPEFAAAISGCARNLRLAAGDYLFREGEPANDFYLIRQGTVALELDSPGQQPIVVAFNRDVPVMTRLRLQMLVRVSVSCSWNRRISSAVAVSGERFQYAQTACSYRCGFSACTD
jgi:CRP-like cAMP-binding protein